MTGIRSMNRERNIPATAMNMAKPVKPAVRWDE
jgi:hypothetical protein